VEDEVTVRIYYEGRLAKLELKTDERPKIDPDFEEATEGDPRPVWTSCDPILRSAGCGIERFTRSSVLLAAVCVPVSDVFGRQLIQPLKFLADLVFRFLH
jgi:hypothetical protein